MRILADRSCFRPFEAQAFKKLLREWHPDKQPCCSVQEMSRASEFARLSGVGFGVQGVGFGFGGAGRSSLQRNSF